MRKLRLIALLAGLTLNAFSQSTNESQGINEENQKHEKMDDNTLPGEVTFIVKLEMANATKDGFYLNGYVVNIPYAQAKKLTGKTIRVTGKVTIVQGIKNTPGEPIQQGRMEDTKFINTPFIEIMDE
ncbi:MAG: hypothetical protein ABIQ02_11010 [Saprospiraceae bacterium]